MLDEELALLRIDQNDHINFVELQIAAAGVAEGAHDLWPENEPSFAIGRCANVFGWLPWKRLTFGVEKNCSRCAVALWFAMH